MGIENLSTAAWLYEEINLISILILVIIAARLLMNGHRNEIRKLFDLCLYAMTATLISDSVNCALKDGQMFPTAILILEMISGLSVLLVCIFWVLFIEKFTQTYVSKKMTTLQVIPAAFCAICICLSPLHIGIYWAEAPGTYVRGPLYIIKPIVYIFYMILQFVILHRAIKNSVTSEEEQEFHCIELVSLFPIIGAIAQFIIGPSIPCTNPSFTLALLMGYMGISAREAKLDTLTSLNKRDVLENFLSELLSIGDLAIDLNDDDDYYLYMMDVNHFKAINDTFGHQEGDRALVLCSNVLMHTFSEHRSCLCRYGGDEFSAVVRGTPADARSVYDEINSSMQQLRSENDLPFDLSISVGYIKIFARDENDLKDQFKAADAAMYAEKKRMKADKRGQ